MENPSQFFIEVGKFFVNCAWIYSHLFSRWHYAFTRSRLNFRNPGIPLSCALAFTIDSSLRPDESSVSWDFPGAIAPLTGSSPRRFLSPILKSTLSPPLEPEGFLDVFWKGSRAQYAINPNDWAIATPCPLQCNAICLPFY
ncbi:hypothetical protein [Phormidium sp. CCY1219]|uniref:hypothetical protein n=1 Tax=Phormidium sp. CCY1219 TaxID=2886104 RepID=UPI002D1F0D54|nr:hypothetical protein [Phormidium sp. CCY1219]MEB3829556.1 hypothetical protein [Phormidium sp. CCY1219]